MKIQIFAIKNYLAVISLDCALNKDGDYYLQVFLKSINTVKKVVRCFIDDLESSSENSDDSDEEQIKSMKLMFF